MIDDENPDVCQRCARLGRPCVFTPLQKRKQRKRTDTRVAELEREMRAMRAALKNKEQKKDLQPTGARPSQTAPEGLWFIENNLNAPRIGNDVAPPAITRPGTGSTGLVTGPTQRNGPTGLAKRFVDRPLTDSKDVVDSGMISMATARQLFASYCKHLFPHYPVVPIPDSTSADELRQVKPTLFLAIIAAAAGIDSPELSAMLDQELLHTYATKSLVHSEKSLELVQALLISAIWYHPPNKFGQLKYYEYIHMAATMAMDIGIGARPSTHRSRFGSKNKQVQIRNSNVHPLEDAANPDLSLTPRSRDNSPDTTSLESRRTFLACFIVCAGVSMALRRPNMLRLNSYVRECLEVLERSSDSIPSDRTLVAWAKLIVLGDEINASFCYDDPGGVASISDLSTQLMLKDFNGRLERWNMSVSEADMTKTLHMMYYSIRLFLYEIALHVDHSPEDFKAPYQMGGIQPSYGEDIPTQALAEAVAECITASHNLLNIFQSMDVEAARALPVFGYVRVSYAAFVLTKLCLSNASPRSRIGKVIDRSSLKAETFMDRAILYVQTVVGPVRCRVPTIFLALLFKLRQWCLNPGIIERSEEIMSKPALNLNQKTTPEDTDDQQTRYLEGPRIVEHISSSNENSPTASSEFGARPLAATAQSRVIDQSSAPIGAAPMANMEASDATTTVNPSAPQTVPYLNSSDQMELDQNFFMVFGDMSYMDGVSDMNNWASLPPDLMALPDNFTWSGSSTMDATTL